MKNLKEMMKKRKKNNKGFSLVELIVVIAIMVVLVAVLGSTILGYIERSRYSRDVQGLDSVKTALTAYVAEGGPDTNGAVSLQDVIDIETAAGGDTIIGILAETFPTVTDDARQFEASSNAFANLSAEDIDVNITNGAVSIFIPVAQGSDEAPYRCGTFFDEDGDPATPVGGNGGNNS